MVSKKKYIIWDKKNKKPLIKKEYSSKALWFQYPRQAECFIKKYLSDSNNFKVLDLDKLRKKEPKYTFDDNGWLIEKQLDEEEE